MSNILEKEYPELNITEKTIKNIQKYPQLYQNVPVKVAMGKIYTTKMFQKRSDEILAMPLPGGKPAVLRRQRKK